MNFPPLVCVWMSELSVCLSVASILFIHLFMQNPILTQNLNCDLRNVDIDKNEDRDDVV